GRRIFWRCPFALSGFALLWRRWESSCYRNVDLAGGFVPLVSRFALFTHCQTFGITVSCSRSTNVLRRRTLDGGRVVCWREQAFSSGEHDGSLSMGVHLSSVGGCNRRLHRLFLAASPLRAGKS